MKKSLVSIKKFYLRNERTLLWTTIALSLSSAVILRGGLKEHDDFLKEHDLYDEFYAQSEEE